MIVKIADFYYDTNLSEAALILWVGNCLLEHLKEADELDLEHLIDKIEENEELESAPDANDFDFEYSLNELEVKSEEILEEMEAAGRFYDDDCDDDCGRYGKIDEDTEEM